MTTYRNPEDPAYRNPESLVRLWESRAMVYGTEHAAMDTLVNVYNGGLPPEFADYFHEDMHVHLPNLIRLGWDDMANMAGKVFPLYVDPDNERPTAKERAELQEKIGYGYNRAGRVCGGVSMKTLKKVISWWLIGTANAVYMVLPDYEKKTPFFTFRDPRSHFPPVGWSPYTQAAPVDTLFAYTLTLGEMKNRYPDKTAEIDRHFNRVMSTATVMSKVDDSTALTILEFYSKDVWVVCVADDIPLVLSESSYGDVGHPGVMPVVATGLYAPDGSKGRSIFADQVSLQAAMARMFSQKLDFYDRTLYPIIFHTPLMQNMVRIGPYAMNEYNTTTAPNPRMDVVSPAHPIDADQTMAFTLGLQRILNRNPEMMQGAGDANSAKALETLKQGITGTIRDGFWPCMLEAEPRLYSLAAQVDVNCWGNVKKRVHGSRKNNAYTVNYVPGVHLRGREDDFEVEPGLGLAGYQGTLEIIQLYGAELIPEQDAIEQGEWTRDAREMVRRLQGDKLRKLQYADLASRASNLALAPGAISEIIRRVEKNGEDMGDVIEEMEKSGRLAPPAPEPSAMQGPPGMPPTPQDLSAILPSMAAMGRG